jgi:hypothetical protein
MVPGPSHLASNAPNVALFICAKSDNEIRQTGNSSQVGLKIARMVRNFWEEIIEAWKMFLPEQDHSL